LGVRDTLIVERRIFLPPVEKCDGNTSPPR
jgi:hypothetical protein